MNSLYKDELKEIILEISNDYDKANKEASFFDDFYKLYYKEDYSSRMCDVCSSYDIDKDLNVDERISFVEGMSFADKQLQYLEDMGFGKVLTANEKKSYVNYQLQLSEDKGLINHVGIKKGIFKRGIDSSIELYLADNYSFKSVTGGVK